MKIKYSTIIIFIFIIFGLFGGFCTVAAEQTKNEKLSIEESLADKESDANTPSEKSQQELQEQKQIEEVREEAEEAKIEAGTAKKEVEIQQKEVKLEKQKAEVKLKEAEVAKEEAELVKETAKSKEEIEKAVETAKQKEKEALAAQEKVKLAENAMLVAQEKAKIAEEELRLAQERAATAETKIREQRSTLYKKLFQTGLIILVGYLLIFVLVRIINQRIKDLKVKHLTRRNVVYIINILIVLYIIFLWIQNIGTITIFVSVIGAGVVLVLQDVILSMAGWFLILVRRPFQVGDRIELGGVKGDVMDIRLFQTSLLEIGNWVDADQSTGRIVNIPNSAVFKKENYNYNRGFEFIWNEIKILVTFESDWKRAEEIIMQHVAKEAEGMEEVVKRKIDDMTRRYMIRYEKLTPIVYINVKDSGVELILRYLTEARRRRTSQDALCRAILQDFEKEEKVSFAYPTYRIVK